MLTLKTCPLELRGIENKVSQENKIYYMLYCELDSGKPFKFFVADAKVFPDGLKKGEMIVISFELSYFKGYERLSVIGVERAG